MGVTVNCADGGDLHWKYNRFGQLVEFDYSAHKVIDEAKTIEQVLEHHNAKHKDCCKILYCE